MMTKKAAALMLLLLTALIFAGCDSSSGGKAPADTPGSMSATGNPNSEAVPGDSSEQVVHVYSARHYAVDSLIYEEFTRRTGIKVNEVKGTADELINRMKQEKASSSADLLITVDGGILDYAKQSDVLQPIESAAVERSVPADRRDRDGQWVGIATRARVIVYAKDRINPDELSTYEDLAKDRWKGKVLVRSSDNLYNQSLLASFIALTGEKQAAEWAEGVVHNLARTPEGGDLSQATAIAAHVGDIAIMNTYYIGQLSVSKDAEEAEAVANLGILFPNQKTTGTHINISGVGLAKYAKNKENAIKLVEFMTSKEGQTILTQGSFEFPVNEEADMPQFLKQWGKFKSQHVPYSALSIYNRKAIEIFQAAGWK
ncbi:Iron uptake protein A1 [Paenibacillus plantiphilus]|uniref:Iron uptake protein A1 n=2 Tax=Paenibacillus plantiphilus TaxID=2905650 RepID=A0ABN8G2H5_9BACL|nr:Iron uptake protein A1 [Paenibacillus plantiphilus]